MADLWKEDEAAGHVRVVAQVIAGSANRPELSRQVVEQMEPWIELARETLERVLPPGLPAADVAYGIVVWYVGANLMAHLEPDSRRTDELFARAREWAPLLAPLLETMPGRRRAQLRAAGLRVAPTSPTAYARRMWGLQRRFRLSPTRLAILLLVPSGRRGRRGLGRGKPSAQDRRGGPPGCRRRLPRRRRSG